MSLRGENLALIQLLAAIGVILTHSYPLGDRSPEFLAVFSRGHQTLGGVAVGTFLFLSGYLVCASRCREEAGGDVVSRLMASVRFAVKRILRIVPTLAFVTLVSVLFCGLFISVVPAREFFVHPVTLDYLKNMLAVLPARYFLPGCFESNAYPSAVNGSLWVIPWQMQCYGLMLLLGLVRLHGNRAVVTCLCVLAWSVYQAEDWLLGDMMLGGMLLRGGGMRLFAFFLAGWTAYLWRDVLRPNRWIALGFALTLPIWVQTPASDLALALIGGYVLLTFMHGRAFACLKRVPPLSFGVFVFAFPVQQSLTFLWHGRMNHWLNFLLATIVTLILAWVELVTVERLAAFVRMRLLAKLSDLESVLKRK